MSAPRFLVVCPFHTRNFGVAAGVFSPSEYMDELVGHARWADEHGIHAMVMYSFASSLDPFSVAAAILQCTRRLRPVVTIIPFQHHPTAAARSLATLCYLYGRGADLNLVAGATPAELERAGESTDKQLGCARLGEYVSVLRQLFAGSCSFHGEHYRISDFRLPLEVPAEERPRVFIPGSSEQSLPIVREHADSSLLMAKPFRALAAELARLACPTRKLLHTLIVGIVARATDAEAWSVARDSHGNDRRAKAVARVFLAGSRSMQHHASAALAREQEVYDDVLWSGASGLGIDCPKLVGSYERVKDALREYVRLGVTDVVIDLPHELREYEHVARVIDSV
jgi:alkanesulfonate monooxygenase